MYIRLAEHIALRSWKELTYAYYTKTSPYAEPVTKKQAELLLQCDGEHDISLDKTVMELAARGMITACEKGDHPSEWSAYKAYDNRYFPRMNLMLTGKCNYNCLHCFNAADNAPLMTEWSYEELCKLLDQAEECGIHAFTLTGGEPMVHKRFMDILHEIRRRNMLVEELNTNGYYITPDILDEMKEMDCVPLIKISFDGIGYHDWMRNHKGAEKRTLEVMRLCREKGFRVVAQTNVNRRNVGSMAETAGVLDRIGVETMRIIRTTEAPRWAANAGDACLTIDEYYETMLSLAKEWMSSGRKMRMVIWQYLQLDPAGKSFSIVPVAYAKGECKDRYAVCRGARGMVAVTSSGEVVPCMQASGYLQMVGVSYGNLHRDRLKDILTFGSYFDTVSMPVGELRRINKKCGSCKWFACCAGGCRALGLLYSGEKHDYCGVDPTKCIFFKNGWYEKVMETLSPWKGGRG